MQKRIKKVFQKKTKLKPLLNKKLPALTLTEMLIVLIIIGILVLIAIPDNTSLISKAKSTEAQLQLEHLHMLEKNYFYMHSKYSSNLTDIDFIQSKLSTQGGNANYQIEVVEATNTSFKGRATAIVDFDGDGVLNVWEVDQEKNLKQVTPD